MHPVRFTRMAEQFLSDILIERGFPRHAFHNLPDSRSVQLHVASSQIYLRSSLKKFRNSKQTWVNLSKITELYEFQFVDDYKYVRYRANGIFFFIIGGILNALSTHPHTGIELFESMEPRIPLREYMEFDFSLRFRAVVPEPYGPAHITFLSEGHPLRTYTFFPAIFCNVDLIRCFPRY